MLHKPRDKALVEGAVKQIYRSIYPKLENREFYDLESLNAAIRVTLVVHNNTPLTGRTYSRREQYEEIERAYMHPLNSIHFELKQRHTVTVMKASFRYKSSVEEINFNVERGLDRNQFQRLAWLIFVREHKDLFITGSIGTGKNYLPTSLGYGTCQKGMKVLYVSTNRLTGQLKTAKTKGSLLQELKKDREDELAYIG